MSRLDYKGLRAQSVGRGHKHDEYPPDIARARNAEQSKRNGTARGRALAVLSILHREDYLDLYRQAKAEVYEERGPLPGDDA